MSESTDKKSEYRLENLVVLKYASNTCYTQVVDALGFKDERFRIDIDNGVWKYETALPYSPENKVRPIGTSRYIGNSHEGVIGVYDRTNTKHLDSMIHAVREATQPPSSWVDDD